MATISLKKCAFKIKDGTSPVNSLTVHIGDGNITWTESRNIEYKLDRGVVDDVREGDDVPMDVNFTFTWIFLKSDTGEPVTVEEALKQTGAASGWTSSDADTCRPYAVDLEITYDPACGVTKKEVITLPDYRWEKFDHDPKTGMVTCSGKCNATQALKARSS